jgi:hypothetical protein
MDDTTSGGANILLGEQTIHELALLDQETLVLKRAEIIVSGRHVDVDDLGNDHAGNLLSSPSRPGLVDGWARDNAIPLWHPEHDVHDLLLCEENITTAELVDTGQGVLHNTHQGTVALWRHDIQGNHAQLLDFGARLLGLRDVKIHFVTVEISIVR